MRSSFERAPMALAGTLRCRTEGHPPHQFRLACRSRAVKMIVQLRRRDPVRQSLLQLIDKPVLDKNLALVTPRQQLIQGVLLSTLGIWRAPCT